MPADACGDLSLEAHNRAMDRAVQAGAIPITSCQYVFELQQDWARQETYEGVMDILRAHSPYGIQVRFSKWALGEHASEGGAKRGRIARRLRNRGATRMKTYLLSAGAGILVGVIYSLLNVRSPAPPAGRAGRPARHPHRRADHSGRQAS